MRILAVDLGTSSVKLMRLDDHGRMLAIDRAPTTGLSVERWLAVLRHNIATHDDGYDINAIAVTGQMHGLLTRETNAAWGDGIPWHDTRSAELIPAIREVIGPDAVVTTGGQLVPGFLAASLVWVRVQQPDRWSSITSVHLPKDALIHELTGAHVTDPSDAAGTGLFAPKEGDWAWSVVDALTIPHGWLPRIMPSGSVAGTMQPEPAASLGLRPGLPVILAGGDAPVGAYGAGVTRETEGLLLLSTGAQVILPSRTWSPDQEGRWYTWPSAAPEKTGYASFLKAGTLLNAGNVTAWTEDVLVPAAISDRPSGLIALPHLIGTREDPARSGAIIGLTATSTASDIRRALIEGVAYSVRATMETISPTDQRPYRILLGGGLARRPEVRQLFADVSGMPVEAVAQPELSVYGAGLLALHTLAGLIPDDVLVPGDLTEPNADASYNEAFALYRDLDRALSPLSGRIAALDRDIL